jgi:glyceraldehyde 3-phosphate dehydrogenase
MKKIAINGFGRIGRAALRNILEANIPLEVVAINDLADSSTLAHLFKYDSVYGTYSQEVSSEEGFLIIEGKKIKVFSEKNPVDLPWKDLDVDLVLECTGVFRDKKGMSLHLEAGAKKVLLSAPGKDTPSFIMGINLEKYNGEDLIDMGSCTTNCLAPVMKVLNDEFGVEQATMTTIHSYTNDQRILDLPHKDLRRARAANLNIIPTTTGAAKAISKVMPEMEGKIDGYAIRVPTPTVSIVDLVCWMNKEVSVEELNKAFIDSEILGTEKKPLVSSDYIGSCYSAVVDLGLTIAQGRLVKVVAWYDNEWAYAHRLVELAEYITNNA